MPARADNPVEPTLVAFMDKIPDSKELQTHYKNCMDLFQTKRITINNAFNCRVLDCLPHLVTSPDFDVTNMQMVGRTLEMGTKIYICRVDDTYDMVMGLAKRIGVKSKLQDRQHQFTEQQLQAEEDADSGSQDMELGDNEVDENGEPIFPKDKERKTREKRRHKGNFVASAEKIRLVFLEKVEKYADRQARVKEMFTKHKETGQPVTQEEFDTLPRSEDSASGCDTEEALATLHKYPEAFIKSDIGARVKFLQFEFFTTSTPFNRDLYDTWGNPKQPLAVIEEERRNALNQTQIQNTSKADSADEGGGEYQFDANAHVTYDNVGGNNDGDHFGFDGGVDREDEPRIKDLCQVKNMAQLKEFYESLRTMGEIKKQTFSWAGCNFLRNRMGGVSRTATTASEKKTRTRKAAAPCQLMEIDFEDPKTNFDSLMPGKGEMDDKLLDRWKATITSTEQPDFEPTDLFNEDTYLAILTLGRNAHPDVEKFILMFCDQYWNIIKSFEERAEGEQCQEGDSGSPADAEGFGDYDFEGARSQFEERGDFSLMSLIDADGGVEPGQQNPLLSGIMNLETFLTVFPTLSRTENTDYDDFMGVTAGSEGVKYAKHPKPINMRNLKNTILKILRNKLALDENNKPTEEKDMSIDMLTLLIEVFKRADERTARFLSTSLLFLSLLHVSAEVGLFLQKMGGTLENVNIIARGKNWDHKRNIPFSLPSIEPSPVPSTVSRTQTASSPIVEEEEEEQMQVEVLNSGGNGGGGGESEKENEMELEVFQEKGSVESTKTNQMDVSMET